MHIHLPLKSYEFKCVMKYIIITYMQELLKLLVFSKLYIDIYIYIYFFCIIYKMARLNNKENSSKRRILRLLSASARYIKCK